MDEDQQEDVTPAVPPDDPLPGAQEQQRAAMESGHGEVLSALTPDVAEPTADEATPEPPPVEQPDIQAEHDEPMRNLTPEVEQPQEQDDAPQKPVAEQSPGPPPPKKQDRYYVPPKERTRENREDRRAAHDRWMGEEKPSSPEEVGAKIDAFNAADPEPGVGTENGLQAFGKSVVDHAEQSFEMMREFARSLEEIKRKLELERL